MSQNPAEISYYLSSSTQPHYGKASPIQKGLVPSKSDGGSDLCEEGVGFGVPLLQYRRDFFFPGNAEASHEGRITGNHAWKQFRINLVERHQAKRPEAIQAFSWVYQRLYNRLYKSAHGRKLLELVEVNTRRTGARQGRSPSKFFRVESKGEIRVSFDVDINRGKIGVQLDFSNVVKDHLQHIYVSNELGGNLFDHYIDGSGIKLVGDDISGWDQISADWATFCAPARNIEYRVEIPREVQAFRGRELITPDICWSGIIFMLAPSMDNLQYNINVGPCDIWW